MDPPATEHALALDGQDDAAWITSEMLPLAPDDAMTLECWLNALSYADRTGLVCKTEQSDYGFFVNATLSASTSNELPPQAFDASQRVEVVVTFEPN